MFLVGKIDVVEERTLPREESASHFKGFRMPVFRLLLLNCWVEGSVLLHLKNEPDLSRVTEVRDSQIAHLLDEGVSCHLEFIFALLK